MTWQALGVITFWVSLIISGLRFTWSRWPKWPEPQNPHDNERLIRSYTDTEVPSTGAHDDTYGITEDWYGR